MDIRLFPIPLQGRGTADVESLVSYIYRSAFEHGVRVGEFLRFINFYSSRTEGGPQGLSKVPQSLPVKSLIRPNHTTKAILNMLSSMSGQDLRSSVLIFLEDALGRSSGEVHPELRWCPECFKEMKVEGLPAYIKLIWHLVSISYCPHHRTPLTSKCPACFKEQVTFIRKYPIDYCQHCGYDLSCRDHLSFDDISNSWNCPHGDIYKLFEDLAEYEITLDKTGVPSSIEKIQEYYRKIGREDVLYKMFLKDELNSFLHKQNSISLKKVRRIAYHAGIPLADIISGNGNQSSEVLNPNWSRELPKELQRVGLKNKRKHSEVRKRIAEIMKAQQHPPSLKKVARLAEVSVGYIEYRFPDLVREIVKNYTASREKEMEQKRLRAKSSAMSFFVDAKYEQHTKSRKQAYRVLREETGLPKFVLKNAIKSAYEALYLD
ncbi:TniQ family protein [Teredinibacter turnerae]|uniref:TniQ family protein n=1 Tax=Teredinibacter turnerae TaxID=2426 RepID=UPI00039D33AB|nr:TniQ family protein [Teredinibacter turnerae]